MIFAPFASAGVTNWTISTPINPDDDGVTTNAFSVPSNETIVDGWISVNSNPMASSMMDSISISGDDFDNGTYDGATDSILDGNLTMFDDGSTSSVWNFDDNGNNTNYFRNVFRVNCPNNSTNPIFIYFFQVFCC